MSLPPEPVWVGIVNATPDSFSDGGEFATPQDVVARCEALHAQGAGVIDLGAESTRPGATALSAQEEWARLAPVFALLPPKDKRPYQLSLDSRHAENVANALEHGIDWVNDVGGLSDAMLEKLTDSDCRIVLMHSLGVPANPQYHLPVECNPVEEILRWAEKELERLFAKNISFNRIVIDPGIGFGKTAAQSFQLVAGAHRLMRIGCPLYYGHSRKSFLRHVTDDRDSATVMVSLQLALQGVRYLRVHDVARHRKAWKGLA